MEATDDEIYPPSNNPSPPKRPARHRPGAVAILAAALAIGALLVFWGDGSTTSASRPSTSVVPSRDSTRATHVAPASTAGMSDTPIAAMVDRGDASPKCVTASPLEMRRDVQARLGVDLDDFNATEQWFLIAASAAGADLTAMSYVAGS